MPIWKQILLNLYYCGSYPVRWWNRCQAAADDRAPLIVLMYHRIADDRANDWTVSHRMFFRQICWLQKHFEMISLEETRRRVGRGANHRPCASITFDDGYAENCRQAVPFLIKERIPCTYFVTLQNVLYEEPFTHDLVMGNSFRPNSAEQIKAMAAAGVEIGSHAYTHADLAAIKDPRLLRYEIAASRKDLQEIIDRPVRYFAFPFGQRKNLSAEAFETAKATGYEAVCSAYGGLNFPSDDPFHLQRIAVNNDLIGLKNWATGDPRKLHTRSFEYRNLPAEHQLAAARQ